MVSCFKVVKIVVGMKKTPVLCSVYRATEPLIIFSVYNLIPVAGLVVLVQKSTLMTGKLR